MDAKDFNEETRTEDSGSDVEQFIAILERMKALRKVRREGISEERSKEGEKKIISGSECGWMSFKWEDFCDHRSVSVTVKNANGDGDGGVKIQEQTRGFTQEIQGSIERQNKRLRDPVESAANSSAEHQPGKRFSRESEAESFDIRGMSFDLNSSNDEDEE